MSGLDLQGALDNLHILEQVQITYGAIILSFLGAIHWGMEFSKLGGEHGYKRLAIGVVPVLFAWPTTFLPHGIALVTQWLGFTGTWMIDQRASQQGWSEWAACLQANLKRLLGIRRTVSTSQSWWGYPLWLHLWAREHTGLEQELRRRSPTPPAQPIPIA